jgi:hypothetical protein
MMFYNGFNLMIDLIIVGLAGLACRHYWLRGYGAGQYDLQEHWDAKADYWLEQEREHERN